MAYGTAQRSLTSCLPVLLAWKGYLWEIFHPLKLAGTTPGWNILKMVPRQLDLHLSSLNWGHSIHMGSEFAVLHFCKLKILQVLIFIYYIFKYPQCQPFSFCGTIITLLVSLHQFHSVISSYSVPFFYQTSLPSDWLAVWRSSLGSLCCSAHLFI